MLPIILIPIACAFGFLYWASQLDDDSILKLLLQLMFIPLILISINLGVMYVRLDYADDAATIQALADFSYYLGWIIFIIGGYYAFWVMGKVKDFILQKREQKEAEKYD
jgi:hypothetical protein